MRAAIRMPDVSPRSALRRARGEPWAREQREPAPLRGFDRVVCGCGGACEALEQRAFLRVENALTVAVPVEHDADEVVPDEQRDRHVGPGGAARERRIVDPLLVEVDGALFGDQRADEQALTIEALQRFVPAG